VLKMTQSITDIGSLNYELLAITVVVWVIIYFALWKGITNARKVCGGTCAHMLHP
jgi:hypothetical protein